ncbi:trigger factor [Actinorhabdospora filicis]|uniref:trigger factor n=1 Tax=Actinorhabdospora filicis TaxID=1785913 RepID=UPI002555FD1B|nr:trigger factor [Actinorhabdospora filicis]
MLGGGAHSGWPRLGRGLVLPDGRHAPPPSTTNHATYQGVTPVKSTVESLSDTRVRLSVEVPFEELEPQLRQAYKKIGAQVRIPGFRPGKAPARIIDQRVGRGAVLAEAIDAALPEQYVAALTEHDIKALGRPTIEPGEIADGKPLTFTAEVDVVPDFELPDPSTLTVTVDEITVEDSEIDEQLQNLRTRFGTLKGVDRAVQDGDFLSLDLKATVDGEEVEGGSADGISFEVGSESLLDGLDAAVVGLSAGETTTFTTKLVGGEHAGRDSLVEVKVNSVKERELPELDDDFATLASEHDTLDELRADLRGNLENRAQALRAEQIRVKTAEALVEATGIPTPEGVVAEEVEHNKGHLLEQLGQINTSLEDFLARQDKTVEEFDAELAEQASTALRNQLVLDKLAEQQETEVSDQELTFAVVQRAQRQGVPQNQLQQYADQLMRNGQLRSIVADLRRSKALESVVEAATITDTAGFTLGEDELFPGRREAREAQAAAEAADADKGEGEE